MNLLLSFFLAAFGFSVPALPASNNPPVHLKVENATCAEAMAALGRATGISVEFYQPPPGVPSRPPGTIVQEKASFDWSNTTFARALRELCARYRLAPGHFDDGVRLYDASRYPAPPLVPVGRVRKPGVEIFAQSVEVRFDGSLSFDGAPGQTADRRQLRLEIGCRLDRGDAASIAHLENVVARDDRGNVLAAPFGSMGGGPGPFPDEWQGAFTLPGPDPRARKLDWVEGDLIQYRTYRHHQVEVPLPLTEGHGSKAAEGGTFEVTRFEPPPVVEGAPARRLAAGPAVDLRVRMPASISFQEAARQLQVGLAGASGRVYRIGSRGMSGENGMLAIHGSFPPLDEPAVAVVFRWTERGNLRRLASFRMLDVPLLPARTFMQTAIGRGVVPGSPPEEPAGPFYDAGGGSLATEVRIQGRPAGAGNLFLGLTPAGAADEGVHWLYLPVGEDGTARLEHLRPGRYRLLRVYHPRQIPGITARGRWQQDQLEIEVAAGKPTPLPPLSWVPDPGAPPAARALSHAGPAHPAPSRRR